MREKGKRLIAIILSCLLLLSNVTVYAATEAEEQSDTQNTVSVNASEEVVTLPEEPINGSAGEEAVIQNEPNDAPNQIAPPVHARCWQAKLSFRGKRAPI